MGANGDRSLESSVGPSAWAVFNQQGSGLFMPMEPLRCLVLPDTGPLMPRPPLAAWRRC